MPTKYVWWKEQQGISKPINKTCLSFCVVSVLIIKRLLSSASCFALGGCFSLEAEGAQRLLTRKFFFGKALDRWLSTSMANNTLNGTSARLPGGLYIFLVTLNIVLSITATLGNALILVALRKISSIYPPTKLLFRCLAVTDLCVGLFCQPLDVFFILAAFRHINYIKDIPSVIHNFFRWRVFCGVGPNVSCHQCWQTSRSLIGTEIQTRCNFMPSSCAHSLCLVHCYFKRFFVLRGFDLPPFKGIASLVVNPPSFYHFFYNSLNIFVHEDFFHPPSSTSPSARSCSTRTVKRQSKKCTEHSQY